VSGRSHNLVPAAKYDAIWGRESKLAMTRPSLSRRQRIALVSCAALFSLPALLWTLAMLSFPVILAAATGFDGDLAQAARRLLKTAPHSWMATEILFFFLAIALYWGCFVWIVFRFWRLKRVSSYIQMYCLGAVLYAIGEKIAIELQTKPVWDIWYGSLSSLNALSLFTLLLLQPRKGIDGDRQ
jgi:hypothetical protein